ncbi:MAG: BlaI/MecI/CopY family transcriptional regulator [Clostridia bacterium]|nr:BlaI/MecI/CopY family transcriptional regulator [Clostridia bacterium]MBR5032022.1 BlaI/MecI/CopY family transcriptional regulator [Clostridia bacterium]
MKNGNKDGAVAELGDLQARFAELIWENEPAPSGRLVELCREKFGWKKPTTYTVLRKLCEKGLFVNENGTVRSLVSAEEFHSEKSERFVRETFGGSLPSFISAFASRRTLSKAEVDEIQRMIDEYRKEL